MYTWWINSPQPSVRTQVRRRMVSTGTDAQPVFAAALRLPARPSAATTEPARALYQRCGAKSSSGRASRPPAPGTNRILAADPAGVLQGGKQLAVRCLTHPIAAPVRERADEIPVGPEKRAGCTTQLGASAQLLGGAFRNGQPRPSYANAGTATLRRTPSPSTTSSAVTT